MSGVVPVVLVHGGAGAVPLPKRPVHAEGCKRAAAEGLRVLLETGDPLEAAIAAVVMLEDDPLFNAGTGACLTSDGTLELDASVMEGAHLHMGAVTCLPAFRNPIRIADAVREDGKHTFYAGDGAARFAERAGFLRAEDGAMITEAARRRLEQVLAGEADRGWAGSTVGAVACDPSGRVAAATGAMASAAVSSVVNSAQPGVSSRQATTLLGSQPSERIASRVSKSVIPQVEKVYSVVSTVLKWKYFAA